VNLATVVDSALTAMRAKLEAAKVAVVRNYISGPTVVADGEKLRQVFANVLDNAIDALADVAEGRRIDLFIENGGQRATVRVRDNGCGIPPTGRARLQSLLHDQGEGNGPRHGDLEEDRRGARGRDRPGERGGARHRPADHAAAAPVTPMQGRILVVDDEKAMVLAIRGVLSREGYQVETACSGEEGRRLIETAGSTSS
jgi:hypothetical protein